MSAITTLCYRNSPEFYILVKKSSSLRANNTSYRLQLHGYGDVRMPNWPHRHRTTNTWVAWVPSYEGIVGDELALLKAARQAISILSYPKVPATLPNLGRLYQTPAHQKWLNQWTTQVHHHFRILESNTAPHGPPTLLLSLTTYM